MHKKILVPLDGSELAECVLSHVKALVKEGFAIVIGTHGYTGLKKMIMGSVASGVLNSSSVPVLLIRPESCRI